MSYNKDAVVLVFTYAFAAEIDGSHARAASLLNRLASEFSNVIVYSHKNHPLYPWADEEVEAFHRRWPNVRLVVEDQPKILSRLAPLKNLFISLFPSLAKRVLQFTVPGAAPRFEEIKKQAGAFVVSYKSSLTELNGVDASRCIVDTHDLLFVKWAKLTKTSPITINAIRKMRGEVGALDATKAVVAISPSEASFFRTMLSSAKTYYVSSWDQPEAKALTPSRGSYAFDLVLVASGYEMNVRGFIDLLQEHGNWLSRYRIAVCGQICNDPAVVEAVANFPSIKLLGFVEKIEEVYARSKAALAPVDGTGLKMKIVSALQFGLPAFVSEQAFDGLPPGHEGAIFPINEQAFRRLLNNPADLKEAHRKAFSYCSTFNAASEYGLVMKALEAMLFGKNRAPSQSSTDGQVRLKSNTPPRLTVEGRARHFSKAAHGSKPAAREGAAVRVRSGRQGGAAR